MNPVPAGSRLDALTGARALAALAVFAVHFQFRLDGAPADWFGVVSSSGAMGVMFFFALSGFVLTWSYREGDRARAFWRRRFARIYPAYLVALAGGVVVSLLSQGMSGTAVLQQFDSPGEFATALIAQLTLTQAWFPDPGIRLSLNGVGWSLACEAFFYALFPLLILLLRRASTAARRLVQVASVLLLGAAAIPALLSPSDLTGWLALHAPFITIAQFVLGITVALDVRAGQWSRVSLPISALVLAAVYLAYGVWPEAFGSSVLPVLPMLAVLAALSWRSMRGERSWLASRPMVFLGEISYCFYLVHQLVIRCLGILGDVSDWALAALLLVGSLGVSLLAAWALHRLVERPFERWLRGSSRREAPVTVDPDADQSAAPGTTSPVS